MASSNHLVTVCICLLCATHSSCSAHDGIIPEAGGLTKYQDLRHERFKVNHVMPTRGYWRNHYLSKLRHLDKMERDDVYKVKGVDFKPVYEMELDGGSQEVRVKNRGRSDALYVTGHDSTAREKRRNYANAKTETHKTYSKDMMQRIEDIEKRVGLNPHLDTSRIVTQTENDALRGKDNDVNYFDIHRTSRLNAERPERFAVDNTLKDEDVTQQRSFSPTSRNNVKRKKREAHLPEEPKESNSADYKVNLKNIDVDFYVKKLFTQFGDRETMTMDLAGFDRMLQKLDLDRMVLQQGSALPPIESVVNGVRSNSTNVMCLNSADLVSSLNDHQTKSRHTHSAHNHTADEHSGTPNQTLDKAVDQVHSPHNHTVDEHSGTPKQTLDALKANLHLNARILTRICPILLYQKVAPTSYERQGCVVEREYPKLRSGENKLESMFPYSKSAESESDDHDHEGPSENRSAVWAYSSLCILAISACGLLGVAVIPIMHHMYYQQILQFLVALAVGTLSGDAMLHLLPHALSSETHSHGQNTTHSHNNSMWKGLVAMLGVVFFYFTEKCLSLITEWRKKRMRMDKENKLPLRVRVMRNDIGCLKGSGSCSSHTGKDGFLKLPTTLSMFKPHHSKNDEANTVPSSGKICKHKYSEYPYCYDEIATETQDDHHVREQKNNGQKKNLNNIEKSEEGPLSVVSLNVDQENPEPDVNDSLLSGDSKNISNNRLQVKDYDKEDFSTALEGTKRFEVSNGGKKRTGVKIGDGRERGHVRSRSADRAGEMEDLELKKTNPEESYTVILREHSQTHHGHSHSHGHVHSPPSSLSSVVWMVIMGDGLHNFTDGMAIGAAFSSNIAGGFSTAIAVLCHELPHEIGDFAVLLKAGMSARRAVCYNLLSSLLCLLGMVVGVAAGHTPEATAWIFAAAAGMFLYIALVDMIPELSSSHSKEGSLCQCLLQLSGLGCGIGIMLLIAMYEDDLKKLFG